MDRQSSGRRPSFDEIGCLLVWLAAVLALGWFGWLVALLTIESDPVGGGAGLVLVGLPSVLLAQAVARAQYRRRFAWFLAMLLGLIALSLTLMLLVLLLAGPARPG